MRGCVDAWVGGWVGPAPAVSGGHAAAGAAARSALLAAQCVADVFAHKPGLLRSLAHCRQGLPRGRSMGGMPPAPTCPTCRCCTAMPTSNKGRLPLLLHLLLLLWVLVGLALLALEGCATPVGSGTR